MERLTVRQVDAFTTQPFTGNPAAVVLGAERVDEAGMQAIAREMNVSETVFVLPATDPQADLQIRWFTPTTEVSLCGHATIACFHALAEEAAHGLEPGVERTLRVQTRSGNLPVRVGWTSAGRPRIWFGLPMPEIRPGRLDREVLAELLGVHPGAFDPALPFVEFYNYAVIPLRSLESLSRISPDYHGLSRLSRRTGIGGFCAATLETIDPDSSIHVRFFAPSEGIGEDPVTGSAHGPLGIYLWQNGVLEPRDAVLRHVGEQGDGIGHRGRVHVRVTLRDGVPRQVEIGGEAVTVLEGTLRL